MSSIRAIVVDSEVPGRLAIKDVDAPQAGPSEAPVQVEASWLEIGEIAQRLLQRQFTGKAVLHLR
jgi:NADPH2:quinone reductase